MDQPLLDLDSIWYRAGSFGLSDICMTVHPGEYRCLVGATGSGKTMLLELIAGIRKPSQGIIRWKGVDITGLPPEDRGFGFSYQDSLLFPFLSVRDNVLFGLSGGRRDARRWVDEATSARLMSIAEQTRISHLLDRNPGNLSGGERQRVALARAIIIEPQLLLIDEPLSALDFETSGEIRRLIRSVTRARNIAVVHVTHNPVEVEELADTVTTLVAGHVANHHDCVQSYVYG
jgi:ABC-type sugar transport system ATPase subunit